MKLATEGALLAPGTGARQMTTIALRPPFIWGKGMTTLSEMADAARAGNFAWLDKGRHTMDFIHVANLVRGIELALTRGRNGSAYYLTDGHPLPIREFLTPLLATQGVDVSDARSVPLPIATVAAAVMGSHRSDAASPDRPATNQLAGHRHGP